MLKLEDAITMDSFEGKFPYIPERISRLSELACNLWWSWHPEAKAIFQMLSGNGAEFMAQNPVRLLHDIDRIWELVLLQNCRS